MSAIENWDIRGVQPQPRVLVIWYGTEDWEVVERLSSVAGTVRQVHALSQVRQDDFDVLVTNAASTARTRMFVVSIVGDHLGYRVNQSPDTWALGDFAAAILTQDGHKSIPVLVARDLPIEVADLVNDRLAPICLARDGNAHRVFGGMARWTLEDREAEDPKTLARIRPFLVSANGSPLAGAYDRSERSEGWVLPGDIGDPVPWVAAALRHWSIKHEAFPIVGGWETLERWQTAPERAASVRVASARTELATRTAALQREISEATGDLEAAQRDAVTGLRALLEAKGTTLGAAVADAFDALGFKTTDRDAEPELPDGGGKAEDLGVSDPDDPSFDPVVEVKGYDSGAKAGDLSKLARHVVRAVKAGRDPSASWQVVNHWRMKSPDDRGLVLAGEDAVIEDAANDDDAPLLVIDTRDLFRAVRDVEDGLRVDSDVRASLRAGRGRWMLPPIEGT